MPALVGENFKPWAKDQVELRQSLLGNKNQINGDKQSEVLTWMTNQTSWLRISSAISITSSFIIDSNNKQKTDKDISKNLTGEEKYTGRELARNYILYGGVTRLPDNSNFVGFDTSKPPIFRGGVSNVANGGLINNFAYEHTIDNLSNNNIGIVPMPGVESLSIQTLSNGAIRKATFKVIAHSPQQFRIIDALYMRPGYTILIEWGHTLYFKGTKDKPIYTKANYYTPAFMEIMKGVINPDTRYYTVLNQITAERKTTEGNYDGFLGKVTTWDWEYKDGVYDITISAVSMGDIIESLNINRLSSTNASSVSSSPPPVTATSQNQQQTTTNNKTKTKTTTTTEPQEQPSILNQWLNAIHKHLFNGVKNLQGKKQETPFHYKTNFIETSTEYSIGQKTDMGINYIAFQSKGSSKSGDGRSGNTITGGTYKSATNLPFAYIKFKYLLEWLNKHATIKDGSTKNTPYISISTDPCFVYTNPYVYSINPNVCVIGPFNTPKFNSKGSVEIDPKNLGKDKTYWNNDILDSYSISGRSLFVQNEEGKEETKTYKGEFVGDLMNVYININIIFSLLEKNQDKGKVFMLTFLNNLCSEIEKSLGNLNELSVSFDSDENKVFFYDNIPLDEKFYEALDTNYQTKVAKFNILGPKKDNTNAPSLLYDGSFIRNLGIKSQLSPNLGSLIFMSAQNPTTANSLAASSGLAKLSEGFLDCLALDKLVADTLAENKDKLTQKAQYEKLINGIIKTFYTNSNPTVKEEDITDQTLIQSVLFKGISNKIGSTMGKTPTPFVPFNLNFEMDGFSGPKIFQKFDVNKEILPYNYPENLKFIIKSLNHTIDSNGWVTSIDSFTAIKSA